MQPLQQPGAGQRRAVGPSRQASSSRCHLPRGGVALGALAIVPVWAGPRLEARAGKGKGAFQLLRGAEGQEARPGPEGTLAAFSLL